MEKVKETFTRSPARRRRYVDYLKFHGISQLRKIPLFCKTRWNSWFEMVNYTKDYLVYWHGFFQAELEFDKTEALTTITTFLSDKQKFGLIRIFVNFISIFSHQFVQTLDFFQQEKPIFPFVENQLQNLTAYIESNMIATSFGYSLESIINEYYIQPEHCYITFQEAFKVAYEKFAAHIPSHSGRSLFYVCQIFNPKYIHCGDVTRKDIRKYSIITELSNPFNNLLDKWVIYCGLTDVNLEEMTLNEYWLNLVDHLPLLS